MFLYSKWLGLPINTRHKIAAQFGIKKRGSTEVFDNQIKSDGYVVKEIEEALNIDAIQKYLEVSETDMMVLWDKLVAKIEGKLPDIIQPPVQIPKLEVKKAGRPRKNA